MITRADAILLAAAYVKEEPELDGGYRLICGEPVEVPQGWYFDFRIDPIPPPGDGFGGAPGFLVDRSDGRVTVVSWDIWHSLGCPK